MNQRSASAALGVGRTIALQSNLHAESESERHGSRVRLALCDLNTAALGGLVVAQAALHLMEDPEGALETQSHATHSPNTVRAQRGLSFLAIRAEDSDESALQEAVIWMSAIAKNELDRSCFALEMATFGTLALARERFGLAEGEEPTATQLAEVAHLLDEKTLWGTALAITEGRIKVRRREGSSTDTRISRPRESASGPSA